MPGERRYFWRRPKKDTPIVKPLQALADQGWVEIGWDTSPDAMSVSFRNKPPRIELSQEERNREKLAAERDAIRSRR